MKKFRENVAIIFDNFGRSSLWLAFEASDIFRSKWFKRNTIKTFLASTILKTLIWSEKFSIAFRTGSLLKPWTMWSWRSWGLNQITWEVSFKESRQFPQNDPWIFNHLFLLVTKGYSLTFESSVSKIWFDSLLKFSIIACFPHMEIIVIILLIFS